MSENYSKNYYLKLTNLSSMGTAIESYPHAQQDRREEASKVSFLLAQERGSKARTA